MEIPILRPFPLFHHQAASLQDNQLTSAVPLSQTGTTLSKNSERFSFSEVPENAFFDQLYSVLLNQLLWSVRWIVQLV